MNQHLRKRNMQKSLKNFVIRVLRRESLKWPARNKVYKAARVARGQYKCAICGCISRAKDTFMDHVDPVVSVTDGWQGFDVFIERLFVPEEGWQAVCKTCHDAKSKEENTIRREEDPSNVDFRKKKKNVSRKKSKTKNK